MEFNDKQEHILEVAEALFATNGFAGTSVRDIAKEAGVNLAMISYYFGSKEKLLGSLFMLRAKKFGLQIEEIVKDDSAGPLEKMFKLIDKYIERITTYPNFHKIMVREQLGHRIDEISALIRQTKETNQKLIAQIITDGQKQGLFIKGIDIPLMMMTLFGTSNQFLTTQHYYREINNLQDMPDEEFKKHVKKKLSTHLKKIFKAILTNEE